MKKTNYVVNKNCFDFLFHFGEEKIHFRVESKIQRIENRLEIKF